MLGTLNIHNIDSTSDLNIGENATLINIGSSNNTDMKTINIGGKNDIVNIQGALNSIKTTNTEIMDK